MVVANCDGTGSAVRNSIAISGHALAKSMTAAANTSAPTMRSARMSQWPRFQLITAKTSAASAPSPAAKKLPSLTTCRRLSRSVSARCHASGTNTERPAETTSSPASTTWMRASPSLPT